MRTFLLSIFLSIALVPAAFAAGNKTAPSAAAPKTTAAEKTATADAKDKPSEEAPTISLKNKSSFQLDAGSRNPFWPIGFKPAGRVAGGANGGAGAQGEVPPGAFLLTSITLGSPHHFAIINGKTMIEGQQFGLQVGTQIYQVMVKRIEDGQVVIGRGDEEIVVPLRRK